MPILFSLYRVLYAFPAIAEGKRGALGPITKQNRHRILRISTVFGAPLSSSFRVAEDAGSAATNVRIVAAVLVLFMSVTMFFTQRQLTMKNMPDSAMDSSNPMFRTQKIIDVRNACCLSFYGKCFPNWRISLLGCWQYLEYGATGLVYSTQSDAWFSSLIVNVKSVCGKSGGEKG